MIRMKTKWKVGQYSKIPVRTGQVIKINGREIALFRLSNGDIRAVENKSPHPKGGTLSDGLVSGEYIYCPVYDWKISLINGKVEAPDDGQAEVFEVLVEGESVYLLIED